MDITITLTTDQARAITAAVPKQNNPAITSIQTYCQHVVNIDVAQRVAELRSEDIAPIRTVWDSLTPAQRAAVKAAAGL